MVFFKRERKLFTFRGGIHPFSLKHFTALKKIEVLPPPPFVFIPLSQHTGKPAKPLLKTGEQVKTGQKIGEADGRISANIHSSISGTIKELKEMPHPILGARVLTYFIESDGKDTLDENILLSPAPSQDLSPLEILKKIEEAGIVGLGGATFPTAVKLSPPKDKKIDTVIINGCECELYLTADERLMIEKGREVLLGAKLMQKVLNNPNLIIAIEDNKPLAIKNFKSLKKELEFEIAVLKTKYPQGAEKQLIKAILKREVPSGGLPFDVGVVVQNVGTAYAVYEAVVYQKPLYERVITVSGDGVSEPKNLLVRIGTPLTFIIDYCGGYTAEPKKIIFGGPLMGVAQISDEVFVLKGTTGILVFSENKVKVEKENDCIRCGRCHKSCPMSLLPLELNNYIKKREFLKAKENGVLDCIECGSCAYVCPSKIRLVHYFKFAKQEIWALAK